MRGFVFIPYFSFWFFGAVKSQKISFFVEKKKCFMLSFDTYISRKLPLVGLISAVFIIYPNIACLPWDIKFLEGVSCTGFYWYFVYRFFSSGDWFVCCYVIICDNCRQRSLRNVLAVTSYIHWLLMQALRLFPIGFTLMVSVLIFWVVHWSPNSLFCVLCVRWSGIFPCYTPRSVKKSVR